MDLKKFFDSLGLNGTKWQWKILRFKKNWEEKKTQSQNRASQVQYQHKFCNYCNGLMEGMASICPHCGKPAPSYRVQQAQRALGLFRSKGLVSKFLLGTNLFLVLIFMALFGITTFFSPNNYALIKMGALVPYFFFEGEYWRLITYGYLHIGILHLLFNMIVLYQVGPALERSIGSSRFFITYTLALIAGGVADLIIRGNTPIVIGGASGALFGLIGFGVSFSHFYGGQAAIAQRNFFLQWALYAFIFGFLVKADNIAHGGGFIAGLVMGFLIEKERKNKENTQKIWDSLFLVSVLATIFSFVWMVYEKGGAAVLDLSR